MKITMIGHAGFFVETHAGGLVLDPWIAGSTFGDSWDLLEPSWCPDDLWARTKWIWFSHEHPDHFHPPSLSRIPKEQRSRLTVFFQRTLDKKVINWLKKQGYKVQECANGKRYDLGPGTTISVTKQAVYDSWIRIEDEGNTLVNFNDCALSTDSLLKRVRRGLPETIDLLITQFSYAAWPGNPGDTKRHRAEAQSQINRVGTQTRALNPKVVIPAASFVWFSHKDNYWMNAERAKVTDAVRIIHDSGAKPVVLKPGDRWEIGADWDNTEAISHYQFVAAVEGRDLHTSKPVSLANIESAAKSFAKKLVTVNNRLILALTKQLLGLNRPIIFYIEDLDVFVDLDPIKGARALPKKGTKPRQYVTLKSDALHQMLTNPWGIDSLIVSGRFHCMGFDIMDLNNSFNVSTLNSAGLYLKWGELLRPSVQRHLLSVFQTWLTWRRDTRLRTSVETQPSEEVP